MVICAQQINLREHIDEEMIQEWKEYCTSFQNGQPEQILREQIDMALDLMIVAKHLKDREWEDDRQKTSSRLGRSVVENIIKPRLDNKPTEIITLQRRALPFTVRRVNKVAVTESGLSLWAVCWPAIYRETKV